MGFLSAITGGLFGGGGSDWQAQQANVLNPTTVAQANTAYDQTQQGLAQQQAFLQALQAQNGIQNQSNVYNQLANVAAGQGPNPAQAMLNNATGANVANQAALMAGQRGAGANVGMMARQAANVGANAQQNAAGQAAALQAQQSLGALNQMGGLATQQVGQQANALSGYNQFAQNQQQQLLNSIAQQNQANVENAAQANKANAAIQGQIAQGQQGLFGGLMGGLGAGLSMLVPGTKDVVNGIGAGAGASNKIAAGATGGHVRQNSIGSNPKVPINGPKSRVGQHFIAMAQGGQVPDAKKVDAMLSPGEKYLNPSEAAMLKEGASVKSLGKVVPGKAKVKGDSLKNDVVPAKLEEGGLVIPRSVMNSKNPEWAAHKFVRAHMARGGLVKKGK